MKEKSPHILFLPKWYPNKIDAFDGNFIENHAIAISKFCNVSVLFVHSFDQSERYQFDLKQSGAINEIRAYYKKPNTGSGLLNRIIGFIRYRKAQQLAYQQLFPRDAPDICHVHVLTRSSLLALQLKKKGIPFLITEHWSGYLEANGKYKGFLKKAFSRFIVRRASLVHTVSTQLKEAMLSHGLINNYTVIPNVVDTSIFSKKTKQSQGTKIVFVGNMLERPKKILSIVKLLAQMDTKSHPFEFNAYGEGADLNAAKELAKALKIDQQITWHGSKPKETIAKAMQDASFLILFSEYENQPCVIPEALCCGTPVLVPDLSGIKERMRPEFGLVFKCLDEADFCEQLKSLISNHQDYNENSISKLAIEEFGQETVGNQFYQLYLSIIEKNED